MARVTVEDCLGSVANRFELVLVASKRARQIANGSQPFVEWENDKPTVLALREIASGFVNRQVEEPREESLAEETTEAEADTDVDLPPPVGESES